jgi:hypothetical protein
MTDVIIDPKAAPSTPSPEVTALVASLIRLILMVVSTLGFAGGVVSDSTITLLASALVGIATIVWALYQEFQRARKDHIGSVISAETGTPVRVR